jgi:hypothetical protein
MIPAFPVEVRIGAIRYAVTQVPDTWGTQQMGQVRFGEQSIRINEDLGPDQARSTLLHECLHALAYGLGLGLDERTVLALETGLDTLLAANPGLVRLYLDA